MSDDPTTNLDEFSIGTYSWGEQYLQHDECLWTAEETQWSTLADAVALAASHRCAVTIDGQLAPTQIEDAKL